MNFIYYADKKNKIVFFCWYIISIVLSIAYIVEYLKGNRTIEYVVLFIILIWSAVLFSYFYYRKKPHGDTSVRYVIGFAYLIIYTFVQITSNSLGTFVYIFPMLFVLLVYADLKFVNILSISTVVLNIIQVIYSVFTNENITEELITYYEIQIACVVLCSLFLYMAMKIIVYNDNKLMELNNSLMIDPLTKAYNRNFLDTLTSTKFRQNQNVSIAIIDIDNFKGINDTYGHDIGDEVLQYLTKHLLESCGLLKDTFVIRIGGDEFIIFSYTLTKRALMVLCKTLCENTLTLDTEKDETINFTLSIGVASTLEDSCIKYNDLYNKADDYLYNVKRGTKHGVLG